MRWAFGRRDVLNNTSADNREDFKIGKTAAEQIILRLGLIL